MKNVDYLIRGGRVIDPYRGFDGVADIAVRDGVIVSAEDVNAAQTVDATGCIVTPGLIDFHAHLGAMVKNIKMLQNGDIDAFFGVDTPALSDFSIIPLETEPIYFVASSELLKKNGVAPDAPQLKQEYLSRFSYLLSPKDSHFRPKIDLFCEQAGVVLSEMVTISDFSLQLSFAARGLGACFTPKTVLSLMDELNLNLPPDKSLTALKVEGLTSVTNLSFVLHRLAYRTTPLNGFIRAFQDTFAEGF